MTDPRGGPAVPSGDHLDLDALADVLAGERVDDAHLRSCGSCADRLAELEAAEVEVVASLATLPDPAMPEGLAERLTAALRAEPPLAAPAGAGAPAGRAAAASPSSAGAGSVTTLPDRRRRAWLPPVAAAAVLVLAGGVGWSALQGSQEGGNATTAAGGSGEERAADGDASLDAQSQAVAVRNDSGIDYADEALRLAVLPRVLAGTADGVEGASSDAAATPRAGGPASTPGPAAVTAPAAGADPLDRLREPAALEGCLSALRPPDEPDLQPLALDYARFGDAPALAVVLPDADPAKLSLFVVGAGCSAGDDGTLLYARPDRP